MYILQVKVNTEVTCLKLQRVINKIKNKLRFSLVLDSCIKLCAFYY